MITTHPVTFLRDTSADYYTYDYHFGGIERLRYEAFIATMIRRIKSIAKRLFYFYPIAKIIGIG